MTIDTYAMAEAIHNAAKGNITEATLRIRVEAILANYLQTIGVSYQAQHERTITTGARMDALFGTVVIEYKKPGRLATPAQWKAATEQLQGYLQAETERTGLRHAGILIDGQHIGFIRKLEVGWAITGPEPINANNIRVALEYLRGLSRKPLDPGYLSEDFGPQSAVARQCIAALWEALHIPSQKSILLYEEWKHLFGQISGYEREQLPDIAQLAHEYRLSTIQDMPRLLFTIHTYYALIIKLLAAEILTLVRQGIEQSFVERIAMSNDDALQQALRKMEDGGVFRDLQIENLLEGDFFSWYLDQWNPTIAQAIHHMLITLQQYEPGTTLLAPDKVKDLLKRLYQHLIPASLRHDLGEYYTPDWLAEWVLNKVDYDGALHKRILDPSCGTGTFLVQAINRAKERARSENVADEAVLQAILQNVVGFDLNPLAVVAARTNYILALGDLLAAQTSPVSIPIFLSDSIFSPSRHQTVAGSFYSYTITTQRGPITVDIPAMLIEQHALAPLLTEIEIAVQQGDADEHECLERVVYRLGLTADESASYGYYIKALYRQIKALEQQNWNRIWTRIIKNYFASASVGEFDIIAGNPPWLRWTRLPASYRETIKDYCVAYGLFSQDTYVGGIETDISTIVTYSAAEKWLRSGGILGFLLPQTVFKNESSEGFRKFTLPEGTGLQVIEAHDLSELKPFDNVANKTAALFLRKGAVTFYPIPYFIWEKSQKMPLRQDMTLAQVQAITRQVSWSATPIYPNGGPWLTMESQLLPTAQRMIGKSHFHAHKGITSDLNGVYWIHVLEKRPDSSLHFRNLYTVGKHVVAPFEGLIEAGVVFPLARGLDAKPFFVEASSTYVIVPQNGMRGYPEVHMRQTYRKALDYFRLYKQQLEARSSYHRYHTTRNGKELGPYYSLWNVGPYSFADHKVVWREVQNPRQFFVSYLGLRNDPFLGEVPVIPDHKLYFVPCTSADEAHFLTGFLNSLAVRAFVAGYAINTQIATHITEYINIPVFDASNQQHMKLSHVSSTIYTERRSATETELADIERIVEYLLAKG